MEGLDDGLAFTMTHGSSVGVTYDRVERGTGKLREERRGGGNSGKKPTRVGGEKSS